MTNDLRKALVEKMQDEEFLALDEIVAMGEPAVAPLRKILVEEKDPLMRQRAAVALGRIGATEAAQDLRQSLRDAAAPVVISALHALALIKMPDVVKDVEGLLGSSDVSVRRVAAKTLGDLQDPAAITALESVLDREGENQDVAAEAARALQALTGMGGTR